MAGIRTEITLKDNVTSALRKMVSAVENFENVLSSVDSRFRNAFDTKSIKAVENEIAKAIELTNTQRTTIEKLNNRIEQSAKKRAALEAESASYGTILITQSKARADANAKLELATKRQAETEAIVKERLHQIKGLENAIAAAKNDEEASAYEIEAMELRRNKWVAQVERGQARVAKYTREIKDVEQELLTIENMVGDAQKRKAEIADQLKYAKADEAHWANQIAGIERKAADDQAKLAAQQAKKVQQALDAIHKEEAAAIEAVKRQDAAKWKAWDAEQARMGKMIAAAEKRESEEEELIRKREAAAIAAVKREEAAKWAAWDKEQAAMGKMITQAEKRNQKEKQMLPAINANTIAQKKHNLEIEKGASNTNMLWSKIKSIGGAYLGVQTVGSVIQTADALAANDARLSLMVKEGESVQQLSDQIYEAAMRSRVGYLAMADSVAKVGIQAGNLFDNSGQMVRFMETFNKMGVISKATTQQTNAAMTQLIQALSFGQLRGDELKSILENMPMVAHALADEMTRTGQTLNGLPEKLRKIAADGEVTADEIRELGYEGQISANTVIRAMLNGAEKIDKMAKNMTWTWAQVWEVFKSSALRAFTPVLNGISKLIQTERFKRFATWVDNIVKTVSRTVTSLWTILGPVFGAIFDAVAKIGDVISNNWSWIAPIVMGIVGAMYAYKAITMAVTTWTAILNGVTATKNLLTSISAAKTAMATGATFAQTAAQWGLNAALLACPITWIILGIIAVIAVLYIAVAVINKVAGTSISATGIICAAFTALGVHIWNIVAYMWNTLASFIEFFVNVWSEPMYSVKKLFVNLATNVLDSFIAMTKGCDEFATKFANAILWAVNKVIEYWNKFIDILPDDLKSMLGWGKGVTIEARTSFTSDLESLKSGLNSLVADKPDGYWEAPRMQQQDLFGTSMKAYDWGDKMSSKVEGVFGGGSKNKNGKNPLEKYAGDFSKALDGGYDNPAAKDYGKDIAGNTDDIAKNTGETAKNTEGSEDDFKYLRQLAERDSMNRSQLMNFKVDMSNVNHIKSGLDVDEVMRRLAQELYHEVTSKMEGVY